MSDPIAKLRALLDGATSGEWSLCPMDMYILGGDGHFVAEVRGFGAEVSGQRREGTQKANGQAIAALRNLAPELLAAADTIRSLRTARWEAEARAAHERAQGMHEEDVQRGAYGYVCQAIRAAERALAALDAKAREVLGLAEEEE